MVLKYEETADIGHADLPEEYLQTYIKKFDKRFAEISFLRKEMGAPHNSFEWGYQLYQCVKDGDKKELYHLMREDKDFRYGVLAREKLRSVKNLVIALVSAIIQFAMLDHIIESEPAFTAGDACVQLVEETDDVQEVLMNAYTSMLKLCDLVEDYRQKTYHPLVSHTKKYIEGHLHELIEVNEIAKTLDVSREYLSRTFRSAEKCSLQQYIHRRKIKVAKEMLQYSDLSVAGISKYLGFSSQSNFAVIFRKETGMTPSLYRKSFSGLTPDGGDRKSEQK